MKYIVFFASAFISQPAFAATCADAVKDGTRRSDSWSNNFVRTQLTYNRIQALDSGNSNSASAENYDGSYSDFVASVRKSKAKSAAYKRQLDKLNIYYIEESQKYHATVSSGDGVILGAWLECMKNRQGLVAYFLPLNAKRATLVLKWIRDPNDPQSPSNTTLKTSIITPKWMIPVEADGPRCWRSQSAEGARAGDGVIDTAGCSVTFEMELDQYKTPVSLRIDTARGGADVFLAPRVRYVEDRESILVDVLANAPLIHNYTGGIASGKFSMSASDVQNGWVFDPESFKSGSSSVHSVSLHRKWGRSCGTPLPSEDGNPVLISDTEVEIGASGVFRHHGTPGEFLICKISGSLEKFRVREVPY